MIATLGRDPDAYGSIVQAQQAYTTAQVQDVMQHRGEHPDLTAAVQNAVRPGGTVEGVLNGARANEIAVNQQVSDAAYNAKIDQNAQWATKVWGFTGGKLVDKIPGAGGYLNGTIGDQIQNYANTYKVDHSGATSDAAVAASLGTATGRSAYQAVQDAAVGSGMTSTALSDLANSAVASAQDGFSQGYRLFGGGVNVGATTGSRG